MDKEIIDLIEKNTVALATSSDKPHCIAVADVKVIENKILIGDNYMKQTIRNILENNHVALCVWSGEDVGYEIIGKALYHTKGKWLDMVKEIHIGYPAKGAIVINIEKIKALA